MKKYGYIRVSSIDQNESRQMKVTEADGGRLFVRNTTRRVTSVLFAKRQNKPNSCG